jgi:hypothetical protein
MNHYLAGLRQVRIDSILKLSDHLWKFAILIDLIDTE